MIWQLDGRTCKSSRDIQKKARADARRPWLMLYPQAQAADLICDGNGFDFD